MADGGNYVDQRRHHNKKNEPMTVPPGLGMETVTLFAELLIILNTVS